MHATRRESSRRIYICGSFIARDVSAEETTQPKLVKKIVLPGYTCWPGAITLGRGGDFWVGNSANCGQKSRASRPRPGHGLSDQRCCRRRLSNRHWPRRQRMVCRCIRAKNRPYIAKIIPQGQIIEYPIADQADSMALGPAGNWWITQPFAGKMIAMNLKGQVVAELTSPHAKSQSQPWFQDAGITLGPDGNMWFTEPSRKRIGKLIFSTAR